MGLIQAYRAFCFWMTPTPISIETKYTSISAKTTKNGNDSVIVPLTRTDSKKATPIHNPLQRLNSDGTVVHTPRHAFDQMYTSTTSHAFDSLHDPLSAHAFDAAYRPTTNHGMKTGSRVLQAGVDGFVTTHAFDRTLSKEKDSLHHHSKHHAFDSNFQH